MQNFATRLHVSTFAKTIKNNTMAKTIKSIALDHVKKRLAQVTKQLEVATEFNDLVEIALYSRVQRELKKLLTLMEGK